MLWSGHVSEIRGICKNFLSKTIIVNCSMQSGQSPRQIVVKHIRAYGNVLYKCHIILIIISKVLPQALQSIAVNVVLWVLTFVALRSLSKLCPTSIVSLWIILNSTACTSWIVVVTPRNESSVTPLNLKQKRMLWTFVVTNTYNFYCLKFRTWNMVEQMHRVGKKMDRNITRKIAKYCSTEITCQNYM